MARHGSRIAARLRRRLGLGGRDAEPGLRAPAAALRGVPAGWGEPPSADSSAGEAELDTLRGELVRELDRLAEGDDGSGSFRRIAPWAPRPRAYLSFAGLALRLFRAPNFSCHEPLPFDSVVLK